MLPPLEWIRKQVRASTTRPSRCPKGAVRGGKALSMPPGFNRLQHLDALSRRKRRFKSRRGRQSILVRINLRAADYRYSVIIIVLIARKRFHSFVIKARGYQRLRTLACHAGGRGFESRRSRRFLDPKPSTVLSKRLRAVLLPHCRQSSTNRWTSANERCKNNGGNWMTDEGPYYLEC